MPQGDGFLGFGAARFDEVGAARWGQLIDRVGQHAVLDLSDVDVAEVVDEIAQGSFSRPIPEMKATTPPISRLLV